ncbi:BPSS1780 family membrane protein [Psychrobacter sp. ASPA161_6]|uniref:BPSS1780 family membrane protein n=1 Tax=Psychrobacter sp. ASPA161_6 TaxID=3160962 RepID=UPI003F81CC9E
MSSSNHSQSNVSLQKPNGQPPNLPPTDEYGGLLPQLLASPRKCDAAAGMSWIVKAFGLFKDQPLLWFGMSVTFLVIVGIASSIPLLNILIIPTVFMFLGGFIKGAAAQSAGAELRFDHLFSAFKSHWQPLLILGLLYLVGIIICMIPLFIAMGSMMFSMMTGGMGSSYGMMNDISLGSIFLGYLLSMLLIIPLYMALWFAPALVVLHNLEPIAAMKKSFEAGKVNVVPILVYGLISVLLLPILTMLTLGLGVLLILPIMLLTYYTSYRDVWTDQPVSAV